MSRIEVIIVTILAVLVGFVSGGYHEKWYLQSEAQKAGSAEYYLDGNGRKQFRWKTHAFTWSDLNFDKPGTDN